MSRLQWVGLVAAIAYLVFYMGGRYSFEYTHECVRSHQELQEVPDGQGDVREAMVTVCDWHTANAKRWTFTDPVKAVGSAWVTGWADAAILGGLTVLVGGLVGISAWRDRRARRQHEYDW